MKRQISKFLAIILSAVLCMTACSAAQGDMENESVNNGSAGGEFSESSSADRVEAGNDGSGVQYAYSGTVIDFKEYGGDIVVHDLAVSGEQIYVLIEAREWGDESADSDQKQEYTSSYQVFSCMADGSGKAVSDKLYLPESGGYVSSLLLSDEGNAAALFYSDTDESVSLLFWGCTQNVHWQKEVAAGGYLFFREDGFVILARKGEGREAYFYDAQGELTDKTELQGESLGSFQDLFYIGDDRFLVISSDQEGTAYTEVYDVKSGEKQRRSLPDYFARQYGSLRYQIFQGTAEDMLLCDPAGVYQWNPQREVLTERMLYVDADLDISGFQAVKQIDGSRIAGIFHEGGTPKLGLFERIEVPQEAQKQIVVLGIMNELDGGLRRQVVDFNRKNSRYRVTVKQYVTVSDELDALAQLNADILAGNMPDILLADQDMPLESYCAKGLLADVGKLLAEDGELDAGQFMENVLDAFRINGTLYHVIPAFCVDTLVAKRSKAGERTGWNQEEFSAVSAGLPENMERVSQMSRYDYLENYMRVCGREYIDVDQRKCNFQAENFRAVLQFAGTLPEYVGDVFHEENSYDSRYLVDRALLQPVTIRYIPDLAQQIYGCMGEEIVYVGYPAESREGSCIRIFGMSFVLSGRSDSLDGAWEFARSFLTEEFQRDRLYEINGSGLPIRQDVFDEQAQRAAVQEGYCFINDEYVALPPMTGEQIDQAVGFIRGLHHAAFEDEVIMNIIREEAESFFAGQKTAADVTELIQNRVQLYLDEGRQL